MQQYRTGRLLSLMLSSALLTSGMALAQARGAAAVPTALAMWGELFLALSLWAVVSWLLFNLFWRALDNPPLGVRIAYLFTGVGLMAYLLWSWYPRYLEGRYGSPGNMRWIIFGAALLVFLLLCFLTYRSIPAADEDEEVAGPVAQTP